MMQFLGMSSAAAFFALLALAFTIWSVVRVARRSVILAIGVFFFWPATLLALIRFWGDEDADIRVPFSLTAASTLLSMFLMTSAIQAAIDETAAYYTDDEIAEIRQDDPALASRIELARAKAWSEMGKEDDAWLYEEDGDWEFDEDGESTDGLVGLVDGGRPPPRRMPRRPPDTPTSSAPAPVLAPVMRSADELEAERLAQRRMAAASLSFRLGTVNLDKTGASLDLPEHFRFIHRDSLAWIARLHDAALETPSRGWIIHERMDLARDDAWFVELRFVPVAQHIRRAGVDAEGEVDDIARSILGDGVRRQGPQAGDWNAATGVASWSSFSGTEPGDERADFFAARRVAQGTVALRMVGVEPSRHELAMRATRLLAGRIDKQERPR